MAPAGGKVTRSGQPAIGGKVLFLPVAGGKQAIGIIQPDGAFQLSTFGNGDGALVGEHHAVIVGAAFAAAPDDDQSYEAAAEQRFQISAEGANDFVIDVATGEWKKLAQ